MSTTVALRRHPTSELSGFSTYHYHPFKGTTTSRSTLTPRSFLREPASNSNRSAKSIQKSPRSKASKKKDPQLIPTLIPTLHSADIKYPLRKGREQTLHDRFREPLKAEEYMGRSRLSSLQAKSEVITAREKVVQCKYQERYLLHQVELENGSPASHPTALEPHTSIALARLTRQTLVAEYKLAVAERDACQKELTVLQDVVDEALVHMADGGSQEAKIYRLLSSAGIHAPLPNLPVLGPIADCDRPVNLFDDDREDGECSDPETDSIPCDSKAELV